MAGGGDVSVRVPINLEIMNNSLTDIKKTLDSLSPNTKNFESLKGIVSDMEKTAKSFSEKMAVPFKSKAQFTSAGKDLDKFLVQMEKFNKLRDGLTLDNFKVIDPAALQQIQQLKQELEKAQQEIAKIQQQTLQGLFNDVTIKESLIKIDPSITEKSFEEVEQIVNEKIDKINNKINEIGTKNTKAIQIGDKLKQIVGKDFISADVLGEDVFNQFFKKNGAFKSGQQGPFLDYLKDMFNLSPQQIQDLTNKTASQINEILNRVNQSGNREFFKTQRGAATRAENSNKNEIQEYQAQRDLLSDVQMGMDLASASAEKYREKIQETNKEIQKTGESSKKVASDSLANNYNQMASAVENYKASLESADASLMKLSKQQMTFNSLKSAVTNFMGFAQVAGLVKKAWSDATAHIRELDEVMTGIAIVTDMSTADLWNQVDAYTQLAQKYGTTIKGAYEVSQIYYQQGLKSAEVMTLTEETLKLSKISGLDYATTTDYMTTALRGFHMEMSEASRVVDVYSALAANTAVSQQELAEAMTRTASSMEAVGTTFEESSAMIATIVAATRESASNIGSAMKSIASRYGELTKDPTKLIDSEGEEMSFNKVDTALRSVGISMHTADGQFRSFTEVILELSDAWDTLDSRQQRYIATQMAGNRQQSRFLALVSNGDELRQNLEIAQNSEGTGNVQVSKSLEGLEAKLNRVQTAWQEFYTTIGIQDVWKGFLDGSTEVLNTLNRLPKLFNTIPILAINAIANLINAVKTIGTAALSGLSKMIIPHISAAMSAAEQVSKEGGDRSSRAFVDAYNSNLTALKGGVSSRVASNIAMIGGAISSLSLMFNQATAEGKKLAGVVSGLGALVQAGGGIAQLFIPGQRIMGIMNIISGIMSMVSAYNVSVEDLTERAERLKTEAEEAKNTAIQLKSKERDLNTLINKYNTLKEHRYDSEEAAQDFQEIMNEIGEQFPELVASMDEVGNVTLRVNEVEAALTAARNASAEAAALAAKKEREYQEAKIQSDRQTAVEKMDKISPARGPLEGMNSDAMSVLQSKFGVLGKGTANDTIWGIASQLVQNPFRYNLSTTNKNALENIMRGYSSHWAQQYKDQIFTTQGIEEIAKQQGIKIQDFSDILENVGTNNQGEILWKFDLSKIVDQYYNALLQIVINSLEEGSEERKILEEYSRTKNVPTDKKFNETRNKFFEAKEQFKQNQSDENLQILIEAYNNYSDAYENLNENLKIIYGDVATELTEYEGILKELGVGQESLNISRKAEFRAQLAQLQQKKEYSFLSNTNLNSIMTQYYEKQFEDSGQNADQFFMEGGKADIELKNAQEIWNELINTGLEQVILDRIKDPRFYATPEEIFAGTNINSDNGGVLWQAVDSYFIEEVADIEERVNGYEEWLLEQFKDNEGATAALKGIKAHPNIKIDTGIEEQLYKMIGNYLQIISQYSSNDMIQSGGAFGGAILTRIQQAPEDIQAALIKNTITSVEGIDQTLDLIEIKLQDQTLDDDERQSLIDIQDALVEMKGKLTSNINLSLQAQLDEYRTKIDNAVSYASKAKFGVSSMEDAEKLIDYYNQFMPDSNKLSFSDFTYSGKKFKLINADSVISTATEKLRSEMESTNSLLGQIDSAIGQKRENIEQFLSKAIDQAGTERQLLFAILGETKFNQFFKDNKFIGDQTELRAAADEALALVDENAKSLNSYGSLLLAQLAGIQEEAKSLGEVIQDIVSNPKKISIEDYDRLKELYPALSEKITKDVYGNYVISYANLLESLINDDTISNSMTLSDRNAAIAQTKNNLHNQSIDSALQNIITNSDDITEEMLSAWATALGVNVENIRSLFTKKDNGRYRINGSTRAFIKQQGIAMDVDEVAGEYENKYREAIGTVYNSFTSAITSGEDQYVANTAENRDALQPLIDAGVAKFVPEYQRYVISVAGKSTEELIKLIEDSDLTQEQKNKDIDSVLKAQQGKTFESVFSSILKDTKNISYDTMQKLADFYHTSVETLVNTDAFEFDQKTQTYRVKDKRYLRSILTEQQNNLTETAYRSLEAQLYVMENEFNGQAMSFLSNTSIKETDVADILNKFQESTGENLLKQSNGYILSLEEFINSYFVRGASGNLEFKSNQSFRILAGQLGLTEEQIQNALMQRISNTISNLSTLSSDIISGIATPDKMNTILQELRKQYKINKDGVSRELQVNDIFDYNEELHKFVYSQFGIMLRVRQLKEQLNKAKTEDDALDIEHQLDMFMTDLGKSIDITGYFKIEKNTLEGQKAYDELIRSIDSYNAAADEAGKPRIERDKLLLAVNGDLTAIQEIYTTLGKDITSDELVTIAQTWSQGFESMMTALESGANTIVDESIGTMLEEIGAVTLDYDLDIPGKVKIAEVVYSNLAESYAAIYDGLVQSGTATTKQLNEVALKMAKAQFNTEQVGIDLLNNATEMTIDQFAGFMENLGQPLTKEFLSAASDLGAIESLGGNKIRVKNFQSLLGYFDIQLEKDTEAYKNAWNSYVDARIKEISTGHEYMSSFITTLSNVNIGDYINVSRLGLSKEAKSALGITDDYLRIENQETLQALAKQVIDSHTEGLKYLTTYERNQIQRISDGTTQKLAKISASQGLLDNWDNLSYEVIETFAKAFNVDTEELINTLFEEQNDGSYRGEATDKSLFINWLDEVQGINIADKYMISAREAVNNVYSTLVSAFTSGETQYLNKSAEVDSVLNEIGEDLLSIEDAYGQWIIDLSAMNVEDMIAILQQSGQSSMTIAKNIDTVLESARNNSIDKTFTTLFEDISTVSYEVMTRIAEELKLPVKALIDAGLFKFDSKNNSYKISQTNLALLLEAQRDTLDKDTYAMLEGQLYAMQRTISDSTTNLMSSSSIKTTDVGNLIAQYYQETGKDLLENTNFRDYINKYFIVDADKNLQFKDKSAVKEFGKQFGLTDDQIAKIWSTRVSKIISSLNTAASDITKGYDSYDKADAVLQDMRAAGYDVNFSEMFKYEDALNRYVYTEKGVITRVTQLTKQLNDAVDTASAIEQLDQFIEQLGSAIDIVGYLQLDRGTAESQKALKELENNISNYNIAALYTNQLKDIISNEDLNAALNGDIQKIKEIYSKLGKELTSSQLLAIDNMTINNVENAIKALESGVGTVIDQSTYILLEAAGAFTKDAKGIVNNVQQIEGIDGKYRITGSLNDITTAYEHLYATLAATNKATVQQLNEVAGKIAKSQVSKQQSGIEMITNGASMTIDQFTNIFDQLGITLDRDWFTKGNLGKYLTFLGGDTLQISDLNGLINEEGLRDAFSTEKGKEALKSYTDSMITQGNSVRERILQLATDIEDADLGDKVNVAGLEVNGQILTGTMTVTEAFRTNIWEALIEQYKDYLTDYDIARIRNVNAKSSARAKYDAAKTIVDNWNNISYDMLETFAKANNYTMESVLKTVTQNADGSYSGIGNKLSFATFFQLDDKYIQNLRKAGNNIVRSTLSEVINGNISFLENATETRISITDDNRTVLEKLRDEGYGRIEDSTQEFIIDAFDGNIDAFVTKIREIKGISQQQKNQWINQAFKAAQSKTGTSILTTALNNSTNLDYDTVQKLNTQFGITVTKYNTATKTFFLDLEELSKQLDDLEKLTPEQLAEKGFDKNSLRNARAQVNSLIQSSSVYTRGNALISGRNNISQEMINSFLEVADITEQEVKKYMTQEGQHWKMNDAQALTFAKRIGMSQTEIFNTFATNTANTISNLGNSVTRGFTDISTMQGIVDVINDHMDIVAQWLTGGKKTIDSLFEYNEALQGYMLSPDALQAYVNILRQELDKATDAGQKELLEGQLGTLRKTVKDAINFDTLFTTGASNSTIKRNRDELKRELQNYMAVATNEEKQVILTNLDNLYVGGAEGVAAASAIYSSLGKDFTSDDADKYYRINLSQLEAAREDLDKGAGSFISQWAANIGVAAGYFEVSTGENADGLVQILKVNKDNYESALKLYYSALIAQGEQDVSKLNAAVLDIWGQRDLVLQGKNDLLTKGEMTYREFGEGLIAAGIDLTESMLDDFLASGLIEHIAGTNKIKISNFEAFAARIGITDTDSKAYKDAYSTFIDTTIKDLNETRTDITSAMSSIQSAKQGDKLNIYKAMAFFDDDEATQMALIKEFYRLGAEYTDGILTIGQNSNLLEIARTIGQAAQDRGIELEQTMLELADSIQKAIEGYIKAIASGIKGGITNTGRQEIMNFASQLGVQLEETDFVRAADGMKLTTAAANELYQAMKRLDNVDTSEVFNNLQASILKRDTITTMDGVLAKINSLQEQINTNNQKINSSSAEQKAHIQAVNAELERELALYHEIALSQMSNPDNYSFMDKALPDQYKGALNYWESTAKMMQTMTSSAKSGYMGVQDFYNIAQEMEHLATLSGHSMKFMGVEIGEGAMTAAELIEKGMSNLKYVEGKGMQINLKGLSDIGLSLSQSASQMAAGVEDGIHDLAQSQVSMLDGLISMLEVIVAMEGLEDITGEDNDIDISDLFPNFIVNGQETGNTSISPLFDSYLVKLDSMITGDEKLAAKFAQFEIAGHSLVEIIHDLATHKKLTLEGIDPNFLTNFFEQIRQMISEEGFDVLNDPDAIFKRLNLSGADTHYEYKIGDKTYVVHNGKTILKTEKGDGWIVDGTTYSNFDDAYAAKVQLDVKNEVETFNKNTVSKNIIVKNEQGEGYTVNLGEASYEITTDGNGNYIYNGQPYTSVDSLMAKLFEESQEQLKDWTPYENVNKTFGEMETWQQQIALGIKPVVTVKSAQDIINNSDVFQRLLSKGWTAEELLGKSPEELKLELGIEIAKGSIISQPDIEAAIKAAKTVQLTPELAPIKADDIVVTGLLHVTAVVDKLVNGNEIIQIKTKDGTTYDIPPSANAKDYFDTEAAWQQNYKENKDFRKTWTPDGVKLNSTAGTMQVLSLIGSYATVKDGQKPWYTPQMLQEGLSQLKPVGGEETTAWNDLIDAATRLTQTLEDENAKESDKQDAQQEFNQRMEAYMLTQPTLWGQYSLHGRPIDSVEGRADALREYKELKGLSGLSDEKTSYRDWVETNLVQPALDGLENLNLDFSTAVKEAQTTIEQEKQAKGSDYKYTDTEWYKNTFVGKNSLSQLYKEAVGRTTYSNTKERFYQQALAEGHDEQEALAIAMRGMYDLIHAWDLETTPEIPDSNVPTAEELATANTKAMGDAANTAAAALITFANALGETVDSISNTTATDDLLRAMLANGNITEQMIKEWVGSKSITEAFGDKLLSLLPKEQPSETTSETNTPVNDNTQEEDSEPKPKEITNPVEEPDRTSSELAGEQAMTEIRAEMMALKNAKAQAQAEARQKEAEAAQAAERQHQQEIKSKQFFDYWKPYISNSGEKIGNNIGLQQEFQEAYNTTFEKNFSFEDALTAAEEQLKLLSETPITLTPEADVTSAQSTIDTLKNQSTTFTIYGHFIEPPNMPKDFKSTVRATGNVALAAGTRTLMGELGPELVVSNGQYFLAGQNGAEFVDLAKDAIVFNHIQTKRLLSNGSSGRGTPLTNERNATSMATGNVRGPAMASASSVLSTLKQLRAQWQALADLSIADLAGKGGGGGGGGNKQIPGFIRDVERWYNWLQKIADLEKEITYQEQLRNKIQSDMISNGKAYYASQKQSYEDMRLSAITSESLYLSQKDYFEQRREQLNSKDSPLSTLYTFDESGQLHFQEGAYQWLADLFKADDYGHQALSPKQQYEMILAKNPQFAQFMKYDESGKEIIRKDYKSDDEYYLAMVKAFSERMDSEKEEMQELFDSLHEQEQAVLEQMQAMNEQLQAMKDNQKEVEESVLKAIEESRQRQIDEMKDTKEAIQKTNEDFIDGLNKSLEKERQMYEDTQKDQELERNRRQLAILKRSGASASQIAQLQEKVDQQARDQYFDKQQEQINAVKEASDLQLEKMDLQIELAQEQLDYEKAHGLLWGQVYDVMAKTPQEIADFITSYTAEYWEKSPLSSAEESAEILFKAEQWSAFRDDIGMQEASLGKINQNLDIFLAAMKEIHGKDAKWDEIEKTAKAKYENLFGGNNDDPGITAWQAYQSATEYATKPPKTETTTTTTTTGTGSGSGRTGLENKWYYDSEKHWKRNWHNGKWSKANEGAHNWTVLNSSSRHLTRQCTVCHLKRTDSASPEPQYSMPETSTQKPPVYDHQMSQPKIEVGYYSNGGINNQTGPAILHGTPTDPEAVLNADDYRAWKEDIKTTNLLYNALADVSALQHSAAAVASSTTNNNSGIVIEHAEVSMNATIANDYDARRAGEQALEQMLTIARKSGTRSAQRR